MGGLPHLLQRGGHRETWVLSILRRPVGQTGRISQEDTLSLHLRVKRLHMGAGPDVETLIRRSWTKRICTAQEVFLPTCCTYRPLPIFRKSCAQACTMEWDCLGNG